MNRAVIDHSQHQAFIQSATLAFLTSYVLKEALEQIHGAPQRVYPSPGGDAMALLRCAREQRWVTEMMFGSLDSTLSLAVPCFYITPEGVDAVMKVHARLVEP